MADERHRAFAKRKYSSLQASKQGKQRFGAVNKKKKKFGKKHGHD